MKRLFNFVKIGNVGLLISTIVTIAIIVLWSIWGLNLGIDFTGGSLLEVKFIGDRPSAQAIRDELSTLGINNALVQPLGDNNSLIRFSQIDEDTHQNILTGLESILSEGTTLEEERFEAIGPTIGQELARNAFYTIFAILIAIILYIAWAFRKVSKPVASWKFGVTAIIALFHDVLIVIGLFVILGKFLNITVDTGFVAALLTVLGYSVNDTIVVFDRVRENLGKREGDLNTIVNYSINETLARSINTTLTTVLALLPIFFFGGETIKYFALALIVGITTGAYSSIFIASPLLLIWHKLKK